MTQVEIRTTDSKWSSTRGHAGRDGRTVIAVAEVEPLTFAGTAMVRFTLDTPPADYLNPTVMVPAAWVVGA